MAVLAELDQEAALCEDDLVTASETLTSLARMDEVAALLAEKREYRRTIFLRKTIAGGGFPPPVRRLREKGWQQYLALSLPYTASCVTAIKHILKRY
ncbi:hypothetical protein ccbrp13_16790 [Ktedonobacteria bacterium brp13]|nr:hypothetical protein ccbrp13_16790 [Ktedonobacteria bacterium brp13]